MPTRTTLEGHEIRYDEPTADQAAFLAEVRAAAADPAVSENDLVALLYGPRNPLLDHTMLSGRSMVTKTTLEQPLWYVLNDYLGQKRVQVGSLDVDAARANYTLTVAQVAEQLGISASAVNQAIQARRLASWRKDGQHWLDPRSVASFAAARQGETRRGPPPRLEVRMGKNDAVNFRVKYPGELDARTEPEQGVVLGTLSKWKRVAVLLGKDDKATLYVLEPGTEEAEVKHGPFHVRGRFSVVEKINNPAKAGEAWRAFEAA